MTVQVPAVSELLERTDLSFRDLEEAKMAAFEEGEFRASVKALQKEGGDKKTQGLVAWLLSEQNRPFDLLKGMKDGEHPAFLVYLSLLRDKKLYEEMAALTKDGKPGDSFDADVFFFHIQALVALGKTQEAGNFLQKYASKFSGCSDYFYVFGLYKDRMGLYEEGLDAYEKAAEMDPRNVRAIFRLGFANDARGNDPQALECYERCLDVNPTYLNALLNLGLIADDRREFDKAIKCFETILKYYPNHTQGKLHLRDALASTRMYVDEDKERETGKRRQILDTPITDFELSVRSRNCLAKVGIKSLGELVRKSEQELLAFKNFGETSLAEIKDLLHHHALRLGMDDDGEPIVTNKEWANRILADGPDRVLEKPIFMLELSVRSKKCIDMLGITTIGELITHTEQELLAVKNFGQTSMNEIKVKLNDLGMTLKQVEKE